MAKVNVEFKVKLGDAVTVKPWGGFRTCEVLELSGLDRISPAILYTVFFYKAYSEQSDGESYVGSLKRGLEKVLVPWFPAAGRFRVNERTGKLEVDCNGAGVIMISAVTDSKLEDLGNLHEYKACYEKLVPQIHVGRDISENPLVVAQITKFACGGLCLGFGSSHALFDGVGAFNFLSSWAHISSGKDESELILPNHSRKALMETLPSSSCGGGANPFGGSIYKQAHVAAIHDLYKIPMQAQASDDKCWETALSKLGSVNSQGGFQLLTLLVKHEVIEELKKLAIHRGGLSLCSTFDVLAAQVWKARVLALKLDPTTNVCLQFPMDARNKTLPPLGKNFTGNAFVLASASCTVEDLIQEPLYCTIGRIQVAKGSVTDGYVKSYTRALESTEKFFPSMRELTIVTDWMKFPFHALDFGWGKVSCATPLATPVAETTYLMPNHEEARGVLVRLGLATQHVHHFITRFYNY